MELATLALTFDKNASKILTNHLSSIEDQSLANIVTSKIVSVKVNQIKTKFGLNENDDGWREKVNEIGKKKKKKIEKESNKSRNKKRKEAQKQSKELVKKRDEWLEMNADNTDETAETDEEDELEQSNVTHEKKSTNLTVKLNNKTKNVAERKSTTDPHKIADPFFVTDTGESYQATKTIVRVQPSGPNDGLDRKERRAQQFGSKPKSVSKRNDLPAPIRSSKPTIPEDLHPSWVAKLKSKGIDKFQGKKMKFDEQPSPVTVVSKNVTPQPKEDLIEKIHPSWAAKQKLKPVISEFKGSKIVFDD